MLMISVDEVMDILEEHAVCTPDEEKSLIQRINQASMFIHNIGTVSEWISVKDKMPKCGERVLIYIANLNKGKGAYAFDKCRKVYGKKDWEFYNRYNANFDVTHWMPLYKPQGE